MDNVASSITEDSITSSFKSVASATFTAPNEMIDFKHNIPFLGNFRKGSGKLFVRPCYIALHATIRGLLESGDQFVITGTPGIGKSFFGLFVLAKLVNEGQTVFYHNECGFYVFSDDGETRKISVADAEVAARLRNAPRGTWLYS